MQIIQGMYLLVSQNEILRFAKGLDNSARYRMSFKFQESRETHVDRHYQYLHRLCTYL